LLSATWNNAFKPYWLELSVAALLMFLIPSIAGYLLRLPSIFFSPLFVNNFGSSFDIANILTSFAGLFLFQFLAMVVQLFLQCTLQRGLVEMSHAAWSGQRPTFNMLFDFKTGLKTVLAALLIALPGVASAGLIAGAITLLSKTGSLPISALSLAFITLISIATFVALGIWLLPATLLFQPFAENPDVGVMEAVRLCFERCKGFRLQLVGLLLISMAISSLGMILCCIGIAPAMALVNTYQTGFWKALSTPGAGEPFHSQLS